MATLRAISALCLCLAAASAATAATRADWPREVRSGTATIVLYQPQFDSLEGVATKARIAVAIQRPGMAPEFGALWVAATLAVDRNSDSARFDTFVVERARFPDATDDEVRKLTALIERTAPTWDLKMSLAELRAGLEAVGGDADPGFRNDPPRIIYRDRPAILVTLDGPPVLQPIQDTPYQRVGNTPFPIVFDPASRQYWLFGSEVWFTTQDLTGGRWTARDKAPEGIARLFAGTSNRAAPDAGAGVPRDQLRRAEIIVSTTPAELIATDGEPQYRPLVGDELLAVTNTGSDLFLEVPTKQYYVVLSGRWYRAASLGGPWSYVDPTQVPRAFADVPRRSDKADVLAHVPDTEEAKDAIMDAMIPQTAAVRRSDARLEVTYDGTPQFDQIPGTSLLYARNSATQVLKVNDRYYAVDQGIWYLANSAYGPWNVADSRPEEVERIPSSSPAYNVKYVYIYDYTPDIVYVGYLPGYTWAFPYRGTLVYGTGYYYRPWVGPSYYYPRPWTWGFQMSYDPWYGWGYGMSWSAGWWSLSSAWGPGWGGPGHGYRPGYRDGYRDGYDTGFWSGQHTGGWFGPGGYRPPRDPGPRRGFRPPERNQIAARPGNGRWSSSRPSPGRNLYAGPGPKPRGVIPDRPAWRPGSRPDSRTAPGSSGTRDGRPSRRPDDRANDRGADRGTDGGTDRGADRGTDRAVDRGADRGTDRGGGRRDIQPVPQAGARRPNNVYVDREGIPHRLTEGGWQTRENRQWRTAPEVRTVPRGTPPASIPEQGAQPRTDPRADRRADPRADPRVERRADDPRPQWRGGDPRATPRRPSAPDYQPSPPVEMRRGTPDTPPRQEATGEPRQRNSRPPPDGGWGNRAVPRDGPSLPAANESRQRSRRMDRDARR